MPAVLPWMSQLVMVTVPPKMYTPPPYIQRSKRQFSGAMDERARKVQKASSHVVCCVAADGASVKGDGAIQDVDAAALHLEKETSIQRGVEMGQVAFEWRPLTYPCAMGIKCGKCQGKVFHRGDG